jgi:cytochrome c553
MGKRQVAGFAGVGLSVILGLAVSAAVAQDVASEATRKVGADAAAPQHAYVGVTGCRICHNTKKQGEQAVIWKASKHATAYETLKTPEALKMATDRGRWTAPSACAVTRADGTSPMSKKPSS